MVDKAREYQTRVNAVEVQLELTLLSLTLHLESDDAVAKARAAGQPLTLQISRGATVGCTRTVSQLAAAAKLEARRRRREQ